MGALLLIFWIVVFGLLGAAAGATRDRGAWGAVLGLTLGPLGVAIALFLPLTPRQEVERELELEDARRESQRWPRCRACGYDLTGNKSGVCPECGTEANRLNLPSKQAPGG